jgi:hypothetical protein
MLHVALFARRFNVRVNAAAMNRAQNDAAAGKSAG